MKSILIRIPLPPHKNILSSNILVVYNSLFAFSRISSRFVLILFFLLSPLILQAVVHNNTNKNTELYKAIVDVISKELGIDSIDIIISKKEFNAKLNLLENSMASVKPISKGIYNLNIEDFQTKSDLIQTIIHELVHIQQFDQHKLFLYKSFTIFDGKMYNEVNSTYETRPYEVEAIALSKALYKKYKLYFKSLNY